MVIGGKKIQKILQYIFSYGLAFIWIVPLIWMFITSFKPDGSVVTIIDELIKPPFTLDNFIKVKNTAMIQKWTLNSVIVATIQTVLTLLVCSLTAFALSQMKFKEET